MQGNDSFRLVVRRGPQPNQTYDLNKEIITLGRDITNDIVINDPEVSRHHLRFKRTGSGYTIEDLGSTNGTFVGGQRITGSRELNRGDMIGLGETVTLGYEVMRAGGEAAPSAGAAGGDPSPYSPPSSPSPAPDPAPGYQAPQQQPPPQQPGYQQPPSPPDYGQPGYQAPQQQPDYAAAGYAPQPPGTSYDPYEVREEDGGNTMRWVAIGCAVMAVFCCCSSVVGLVIIDALSLWYDLPIIRSLAPLFEDIASALGMI
jgi:hypothetical protein